MVAWFRMKYPHLVDGAWASSAPVNAEVDFSSYKDVMTDAIKRVGGEECYSTFENAFKEMERMIEIEDKRRLHLAFSMCYSLDLDTDVAHFMYEMSDMVAGLVQGHRPGRIEAACAYLKYQKQENSAEDLEAFGAWVKHGKTWNISILRSLTYFFTDGFYTCLDMRYQQNIRKYRNVDWEAEANRQMRQWIYQTCRQQN